MFQRVARPLYYAILEPENQELYRSYKERTSGLNSLHAVVPLLSIVAIWMALLLPYWNFLTSLLLISHRELAWKTITFGIPCYNSSTWITALSQFLRVPDYADARIIADDGLCVKRWYCCYTDAWQWALSKHHQSSSSRKRRPLALLLWRPLHADGVYFKILTQMTGCMAMLQRPLSSFVPYYLDNLLTWFFPTTSTSTRIIPEL